MNIDTRKIKRKPKWWQNKLVIGILILLILALIAGVVIYFVTKGTICPHTHKLLINGDCEKCGPYTKASKDQKVCDYPDCTQRDIVLFNGTCEACPDYQSPQMNIAVLSDYNTTCFADKCNTTSKLEITGTCHDCPIYERANAKQGKTCRSDTCGDRQALYKLDGNKQGQCYDC